MALETKVYVYSILDNLRLIHSTSTLMNPKGVLAINSSDQNNILCCPAELNGKKDLGIVQVWTLDDIRDQCLIVRAHGSTLGILELNYDGTLMATASEKGTLIRIFSTKTGNMLQELRRGTENVVLFSVNFHFQDDWLSCISDSGTLHVFNLLKQSDNLNSQEKEKQMKKAKQAASKNRKSM